MPESEAGQARWIAGPLSERMPCVAPIRQPLAAARQDCPVERGASSSGFLHRAIAIGFAITVMLCFVSSARAQMSLSTAVDLALRSNPKVRGAQADVVRAAAQVSQTHDVYVPAITAGAGLGQAYGYLPNPPTLFTINGGSLVFSASQRSYIRSAQAGLNAAQLALRDVREAVAEDTALTFLALDHDQQREAILRQQLGYANTLGTIVQERVDAGQDTQIDLTQAKLTAAQLRLAVLHAEGDTATDREHLARLVGLPSATLTADDNFPTSPVGLGEPSDAAPNGYANAAVASAFANADAKRLQARGDARFHFWPQINLVAQYNRYATFTNSFATLQKIDSINGTTILASDEGAFGVQISLPLLDKYRSAKARESAAEASRALFDAQGAQIDALNGQTRLRHSILELQAQAEVAALQQQLAQQQLDIIRLQTQSASPEGPQMTPKDEQNARIAERDKYLAVIDDSFQLHQAEIQLLRESGELESWLNSSVSRQAPAAGSPASTPQNSLPRAPSPQP
jgi:outer membrane protein TolC